MVDPKPDDGGGGGGGDEEEYCEEREEIFYSIVYLLGSNQKLFESWRSNRNLV